MKVITTGAPKVGTLRCGVTARVAAGGTCTPNVKIIAATHLIAPLDAERRPRKNFVRIS